MKVFLFLVTLTLFPCAWTGAAAHAAAEIVEVGNKTCPVSGDKASPKVFYDYQGKRYHFCCPKCINEFKRDPEKYIAKLK